MKYLEINYSKSNLKDTAKMMLSEKDVALGAYIRKQERFRYLTQKRVKVQGKTN